MLRQRALSAVFIVAAAIIPAILGHPILTLALVALAIIGILEICRAVRTIEASPVVMLPVLYGAALILGTGFGIPAVGIAAITAIGLLVIISAGVIRQRVNGTARDAAFALIAAAYVAVPLAHVPLIRDLGNDESAEWLQGVNDLALTSHPASGLGWLVLIVSATWLTDTAAYLIGRSFGRHKLAPLISPAKTVEGSTAGIAAGALSGALVTVLLGLPIPVYAGFVIGLLLSVIGQIGDLAESLIKRDIGIKDMGNIIPGHGGILDRIDALLFTLPAGYYLILLVLEVNWA